MSTLPKVLHGLNVFIDGEEFIGVATKVEPSVPKPKYKSVNSPGHAGEIMLPTHKWEKSEPKITLRDYPPKVIGMIGDLDAVNKTISLIGVIGATDQLAAEINIRGMWQANEIGEWSDDADAEFSFSIAVYEYQLLIDGKEVLFIDYEQNIVRLNGKPVTTDLNRALKRG